MCFFAFTFKFEYYVKTNSTKLGAYVKQHKIL